MSVELETAAFGHGHAEKFEQIYERLRVGLLFLFEQNVHNFVDVLDGFVDWVVAHLGERGEAGRRDLCCVFGQRLFSARTVIHELVL